MDNLRKRGKKKGRKEGIPPSITSLSYNGPIIQRGTKQQDHTVTVRIHGIQTISSDAAGAIAGSFNSGNPSTFTNWSSLAADWDEFRILGSRWHYEPVDRYDAPLAITTSVSQPPLLFALDRDSASAPGTTGAILVYEDVELYCLSDPFTRSWTMDGPEEANWITTNSPSSSKPRGWLWIAQGASSTINTTFGFALVTLLVQFKGVI